MSRETDDVYRALASENPVSIGAIDVRGVSRLGRAAIGGNLSAGNITAHNQQQAEEKLRDLSVDLRVLAYNSVSNAENRQTSMMWALSAGILLGLIIGRLFG